MQANVTGSDHSRGMLMMRADAACWLLATIYYTHTRHKRLDNGIPALGAEAWAQPRGALTMLVA